MWQLPDDLVNLVQQRRVIPFVGAGFSSCLGLPGWESLLRDVCADLRIDETDPSLSYEEISELANHDFLRVAEYLYIRAGGNIGPMRYSVTNALRTESSPADSLGHVELLNIGAPQVYTTNFDDLIERTFRECLQPAEVVSLPKDVAKADSTQTQVVKYHGDLRFDETLVLTESQYWTRLDFESPMDLKFRSDLLGRSVLFMGYSFSDINIRVIWFKLMQMMRDVPTKDRLPSFIVRLGPNPVLEALFEDVGLRTIVLDPTGEHETKSEKDQLLGEFLADLASAASPGNRIPGSATQLFASRQLLDSTLEEWNASLGSRSRLAHLLKRQVPPGLRGKAEEVLKVLSEVESFELIGLTGQVLRWAEDTTGPCEPVTRIAIITMLLLRPQILDADPNWKMIWSGSIDGELAQRVLREAERELAGHEQTRWLDDDVAYLLDLTARIAGGLSRDETATSEAEVLLERAAKVYPAVATYKPDPAGPPVPQQILKEIEERRGEPEERREELNMNADEAEEGS
ncbi:MAG TPA: SIR2 family protein [Solirubrobacterales bacterium]|nr:SIR2 family protein [Solirubrobacterales bacterium]